MIRIAVVGASGRMGLCLIRAAVLAEKTSLVVAVSRPGSDAVGKDSGASNGPGADECILHDAKAWLNACGPYR